MGGWGLPKNYSDEGGGGACEKNRKWGEGHTIFKLHSSKSHQPPLPHKKWAVRNDVYNPFNLKTRLCRTSTFKASYFNRITKLRNFVCSLKSRSSFSNMQSFKQFVYKTMFTTTVVNTYEVERSCTWILVMTTSDVTGRRDCAYHVHFLVLCYLLLLLTYI